MTRRKKTDWQIRVYSEQPQEIDIELLAQIVIMLGRQLSHETLATEDEDSANSAYEEDTT